jgi:hypothetical protein
MATLASCSLGATGLHRTSAFGQTWTAVVAQLG